MTNLGQDKDRKGLTKGRTDKKYNFTIFSLLSAKSRLFYAPSELRFAPNGSDPNSAVFTVIAPRDSIVSSRML